MVSPPGFLGASLAILADLNLTEVTHFKATAIFAAIFHSATIIAGILVDELESH
jgi:hypothetical protein